MQAELMPHATCHMPYALQTQRAQLDIILKENLNWKKGNEIIPENKYETKCSYETYHHKKTKTLHFKRSNPCHVFEFKRRRTHEIQEGNKTDEKSFYRITVMTHINIIRGMKYWFCIFNKRKPHGSCSICWLDLLLRQSASTCTTLALWRMWFHLDWNINSWVLCSIRARRKALYRATACDKTGENKGI